jgi:hypothetical protein
VNVLEVIFVGKEAALEVSKAQFEEKWVVIPLEHRVAYVADEVLEEGTHHDIYNLTNLQVDFLFQSGRLMVLFEVHTTGDILFSRCLVQFTQGLLRILL